MDERDYIAMNKNTQTMRKLIDIPEDCVKPLKILAIQEDKDLKNYIQDLLISLARVEGKK